MPINSVIASIIIPISTLPSTNNDKIHLVKGYATPSASPISSIAVSADAGQTWVSAHITYNGGKWGWALWEAYVEIDDHSGDEGDNISTEGKKLERVVYSRATDEAGNIQPEHGVWNFRGVAYNAWGKGMF
jgi:sulfite oxidase